MLCNEIIEKFDSYCSSSYLAFRYVVDAQRSWKPGLLPYKTKQEQQVQYLVYNWRDVKKRLEKILSQIEDETGILLSSGIDGAILAALLPEGTKAYTIRFVAQGAIDETGRASLYAEKLGLRHSVVNVTYEDYLKTMQMLMDNKKSPLHAIEPALYVAASKAKSDGVKQLVVGNGADSNFGGMDKLLSKDWSLDEFVLRYTFLEPQKWLFKYEDMRPVFKVFCKKEFFDVPSFLSNIHGPGIIETFENAIYCAGCSIMAPYEQMRLGIPLDLNLVRNGQSKYILRELFSHLYPDIKIPEKIPFARPMDQWLKNWSGPRRPEFIRGDISSLTGDQKWLLFCLEKFMEFYE